MTTSFAFDSALALEQFKKRKAANPVEKQVNNSAAYAGSPMVYYCRCCGEHTETLPESHSRAPKTMCGPCQILRDHGLISPNGKIV